MSQDSPRLLHFPRPAAAPLVPTWRRILERVLTLVAGLQFAAIGFGLATLVAVNLKGIELVGLGLMMPLLFIGLFGANMVVQALRGRSRHEGFFYALLRAIAARGPRWLSIGIPLYIGASLAFAAVTRSKVQWEMALDLGAFWAAFVINVAVHELGHVLAAQRVGMEIDRAVFGPFELQRGAAGYEWGLSNHWLAVVGGFVIAQTAPPPTPRQTLTFALGGPMASAALLAIFVSLNPYDFLTLLKADTPQVALVFGLTAVAAGNLILNLLPFRHAGMGLASDGYLIRESLRAIRSQG